MPVRLVGLSSHVLHGDVRGVLCFGVVAVRAGVDGLVGVGSFLGGDALTPPVAVVRRTSRAAARAEQPEQARAEREGDGQPCRGVHVAAHGAVDAVGLQGTVEGAGDDDIEGGCCDRGGDGEQQRDLQQVSICYFPRRMPNRMRHIPPTQGW